MVRVVWFGMPKAFPQDPSPVVHACDICWILSCVSVLASPRSNQTCGCQLTIAFWLRNQEKAIASCFHDSICSPFQCSFVFFVELHTPYDVIHYELARAFLLFVCPKQACRRYFLDNCKPQSIIRRWKGSSFGGLCLFLLRKSRFLLVYIQVEQDMNEEYIDVNSGLKERAFMYCFVGSKQSKAGTAASEVLR